MIHIPVHPEYAGYLGNQLEGKDGRYFGNAANMEFLLVCTYEENVKKINSE